MDWSGLGLTGICREVRGGEVEAVGAQGVVGYGIVLEDDRLETHLKTP